MTVTQCQIYIWKDQFTIFFSVSETCGERANNTAPGDKIDIDTMKLSKTDNGPRLRLDALVCQSRDSSLDCGSGDWCNRRRIKILDPLGYEMGLAERKVSINDAWTFTSFPLEFQLLPLLH